MSGPEREDRALMKKVASGDMEALDELYRKHRQRVEACVNGNLSVLSDFDVVRKAMAPPKQKSSHVITMLNKHES